MSQSKELRFNGIELKIHGFMLIVKDVYKSQHKEPCIYVEWEQELRCIFICTIYLAYKRLLLQTKQCSIFTENVLAL